MMWAGSILQQSSTTSLVMQSSCSKFLGIRRESRQLHELVNRSFLRPVIFSSASHLAKFDSTLKTVNSSGLPC